MLSRGADMLLSLNPSFRMTVKKKQVEYNLDLSGLDVDRFIHSKLRCRDCQSNKQSKFDYSCNQCTLRLQPWLWPLQWTLYKRDEYELWTREGLFRLLPMRKIGYDYIETPDFTLELDDVVISDIFFRSRRKNHAGTIAKVCVRFADKTSTTVNVPVISVKRIQDLRYLNSWLIR